MGNRAVISAIAVIICVLVLILAVVMAVASRRARQSATGGFAGRAADSSGDESEDDLEVGAAQGPAAHSTLLPHQAEEVEAALKKHFAEPRHIIDITAHAGGDTACLLRVFPRATITAVEATAAGPLEASIRAAEKQSSRPAGTVKIVHANSIAFLQSTAEKADFVYIDPPWGAPMFKQVARMDLSLTDDGGRRWDTAEVVKLVFSRGIAPFVVLKAPSNFATSDFSSHLEAPVAVYPIGRSRARHSGVSYWLLVAGGVMHEPRSGAA